MEPTTKFSDTAGREWNLDISIGAARRIKKELAVNIGQIADGKVFTEVSNDREKLAGVLWLLVESQADKLSVTPEEFANSLGGGALDDAMAALQESIVLFTPRHQRQAVRTMLAKTVVAQEKSGDAATRWIETNAEAITTNSINEAMAKLPKPTPATSGARSPG